MSKLSYLIPFAIIALCLFACSAHTPNTQPDACGEIPILMNLTPVFQQGLRVSAVNVTITKGDFTESMNLAVDSTSAAGTFTDLEIGTYAINVSVYDGALLIATGQGTGTVIPGQITTAHITLQFVHGGLEVVINWGLPYADCRRILLVGNSHTYYNNGVNAHLQSLIDAVHPEWNAVVEACTSGGYTLQNHLDDPSSIFNIVNGNWDLVILQEQSSRPMTEPDLFYDACASLDSIITNSGALTGFYMTWAWRNNPEMYIPIRDAYSYIGAYLDALVNPVGVAFYNSSQSDPTVNLYDADNYHPGIYGTYLASCVMLATIWNINPVANSYIPEGIDSRTAAYLQQIAWTTVQYYHTNKQSRSWEKLLQGFPLPMQAESETMLQPAI